MVLKFEKNRIEVLRMVMFFWLDIMDQSYYV